MKFKEAREPCGDMGKNWALCIPLRVGKGV